MDKSLVDQRLHAAKASNLTSFPIIKATIMRLIQAHGLHGRFLDVGAGHGELVQLLRKSEFATTIHAVDLFDRPTNISADIGWHAQDLNEPINLKEEFDVIICSEVIEHLENPRAVFRDLYRLLAEDGALIITMPNQESIKAFIGLLTRGHFSSFLDYWYPAHITSLLKLDLVRISAEIGFSDPVFYYTNEGTLPKLFPVTWQGISFGLLRGRLFSDNVAMIVRKRKR